MDLFNKKNIQRLNNDITLLKKEIVSLKRELKIKQSKIEDLSSSLQNYKSLKYEINKLLADNENLNLLHAPVIKNNLCKKSRTFDLIFAVSYKGESVIRATEAFMEYLASKNLLLNYFFDDMQEYYRDFEIVNDGSYSAIKKLNDYKYDKDKSIIKYERISNGAKITEKKYYYIYKTKTKNSEKDFKREIIKFQLDEYNKFSSCDDYARVDDIKFTQNRLILFVQIRSLSEDKSANIKEKLSRNIRSLSY